MFSSKNFRKISNINSALLIIFFIITYGAILFLVPLLTNLIIDKDSPRYEYVYNLIGFTAQYFLGALIPILLFRFSREGKDTAQKVPCFAKPKQSFIWNLRHIIIALFFTYSASFISNIFFTMLEKLLNIELHAVDFSAADDPLSKFTNIFAMMFLAPLFEELLFRGTILRNGAKSSGWAMVIITGIFFGLWHVNYEQTLFAAVMGTYAAFMYVKNESIIPPMILHFLLNTIGAVQSLFIGDIDTENLENLTVASEPNNSVLVIAFIGMIVLCLIITWLMLFILELCLFRDSYKLKNPQPDTPEIKKFCIYFSAPVTIIAALGMIALTVFNAFSI